MVSIPLSSLLSPLSSLLSPLSHPLSIQSGVNIGSHDSRGGRHSVKELADDDGVVFT